MARVSKGILVEGASLSVTLDRYQELMRLPIAAFNGLIKPEEVPNYEIGRWTQSMRDYLANYIAQAEERRERELGYYLSPKYIVDERYEVTNPVVLRHKYLKVVGKEAFATIQAGVALTLRTIYDQIIDPVVVQVPEGDVTDAHEVVVRYPNETEVVRTLQVIRGGGNLTITIPRSRLVKPELNDDREDPLRYDDDANFLTSVDIVRRYTDLTQGVTYVYYDTDLITQTHLGMAIESDEESKRRAIVRVYPATLSEGSLVFDQDYGWACYHSFNHILMSYLSGRENSQVTEMETCRLANALMPYEPTQYEPFHQYWEEDRKAVEEFTPYGSNSGAMNAWVSDARARVGLGGKFPSVRY